MWGENATLAKEGLRVAAAERDEDHAMPNVESRYLSETQFNQLTENIIYVATAGGTLPSDVLAALAKALGTLSAFTARREGQSFEEILAASQDTVASFAKLAEHYMKQNSNPELGNGESRTVLAPPL